MNDSEDRITKIVELAAPPTRVWRALTDHEEFGTWFRVELDGPFQVGALVTGKVTYPGYECHGWAARVECMEPERRFAFFLASRRYGTQSRHIRRTNDARRIRPRAYRLRYAPDDYGIRVFPASPTLAGWRPCAAIAKAGIYSRRISPTMSPAEMQAGSSVAPVFCGARRSDASRADRAPRGSAGSLDYVAGERASAFATGRSQAPARIGKTPASSWVSDPAGSTASVSDRTVWRRRSGIWSAWRLNGTTQRFA